MNDRNEQLQAIQNLATGTAVNKTETSIENQSFKERGTGVNVQEHDQQQIDHSKNQTEIVKKDGILNRFQSFFRKK